MFHAGKNLLNSDGKLLFIQVSPINKVGIAYDIHLLDTFNAIF